MEGIVKWFSSANQPWGFIRFQDGAVQCEIFCHYKHIEPEGQENPKFRTLKPGQRVYFEIGPGFPANKGTQAMKVRVLDGNPSERNGDGFKPVQQVN
jgi:cold shock CspA family protein